MRESEAIMKQAHGNAIIIIILLGVQFIILNLAMGYNNVAMSEMITQTCTAGVK